MVNPWRVFCREAKSRFSILNQSPAQTDRRTAPHTPPKQLPAPMRAGISPTVYQLTGEITGK